MRAWLEQPHGRRHKAPPQPCVFTTTTAASISTSNSSVVNDPPAKTIVCVLKADERRFHGPWRSWLLVGRTRDRIRSRPGHRTRRSRTRPMQPAQGSMNHRSHPSTCIRCTSANASLPGVVLQGRVGRVMTTHPLNPRSEGGTTLPPVEQRHPPSSASEVASPAGGPTFGRFLKEMEYVDPPKMNPTEIANSKYSGLWRIKSFF